MNHDEWKPHDGPQTIFHQVGAYEALFGGAKGPGKTETILREGLRQINHPKYRACIFRRTFPQLGECIDRTFKYFKRLGANYSDKDIHLKLPGWTFPSGAKYCFSHLQHEKDKYNHQGREWHYLAFDQLEQFTESQYLYMLAQNRSSVPDLKCYVRTSANPGGVGHGWVKRRFVDPFKGTKLGTVKYFFRDENNEDVECSPDHEACMSRVFIPATLKDNPSLLKNDPQYINRLRMLSQNEQKAFILGDWDSFSGQFFSMWRYSKHVKRIPINPDFKKFLSLDYGFACPSSVGFWQIDYDGKIHRYREIYKEGLTYEKLGHLIMEKTGPGEKFDYCVADPAIWGDISNHREGYRGENGAEILQSVFGSFTTVMRADNNRIPGWGHMRIMLENETISCDPGCKDSIRTIPDLVHDETNVEDLNTDGDDHCGDDWRYAIESRPQKSDPKKTEILENSIEWFNLMERRQRESRGDEVEEEVLSE